VTGDPYCKQNIKVTEALSAVSVGWGTKRFNYFVNQSFTKGLVLYIVLVVAVMHFRVNHTYDYRFSMNFYSNYGKLIYVNLCFGIPHYFNDWTFLIDDGCIYVTSRLRNIMKCWI